ncbi:MAG: hypothetical protein WD739_10765 [Actinomycetota bacterium]
MVEWSGEVVLTTPRLLLRTFLRDDLAPYAALNAHPEVARYLGGALTAEHSVSITDRPNVRSLAVMRRLGMTFDHEAEVEDDGIVFQAVVYSITDDRWRRRHPIEDDPRAYRG